MITLLRSCLFFVFISSSVHAETLDQTANNDGAALLNRVKNFYTWVLSNSSAVAALEPHIQNAKGSARFYLDVSTLHAFSSAFMRSGNFSDDFRPRLENYYGNYKKKFSRYSPKDFAKIKKNGRGPLMETEDMDIFFCAQEYEYAPNFIDAMTLSDLKISDDSAQAIVVSPYNWKTEFHFKKIGARWLISGYCQYK
jgi:hypothetical protein